MTSPTARALLLALVVGAASQGDVALGAERIAPKVLVITMFADEAKPWLDGRAFDTRIPIPGLPATFPEVACDAAGLCLMTTAMGYANAAVSTAVTAFSDRLDLTRTYVLIAGIAGVDPAEGTTGGAYWARYVVDGGLRHAIDPRQIPAGWPNGIVALGAAAPGEKPQWSAGTEVYTLNPALAERAFALTRGVPLADSDTARAYRARYPEPAAKAPPAVGLCDTVSSDTWWHGSLIAQGMRDWSALMTDGAARLCTSQMEDNATLTALKRAADIGRLDFDRVAVLRTASDFDREAPGETPIASLLADAGGFGPAATNAYRVGSAFADAVITGWSAWSEGVPAD
ncbi:MAG: purine nucleoside permease [Amaricoccus sp.]